uniref:(northern house mosquito) hypothetical protein n=1 Tax=Culex pipiens TaxID=7175 RepID=A0A8D8AT34_CULPI
MVITAVVPVDNMVFLHTSQHWTWRPDRYTGSAITCTATAKDPAADAIRECGTAIPGAPDHPVQSNEVSDSICDGTSFDDFISRSKGQTTPTTGMIRKLRKTSPRRENSGARPGCRTKSSC